MTIPGCEVARAQDAKRWKMWFAVILLAWSSAVVADQPAPSKPIAEYEVKFMQRMIDHHTMAIEMAKICLTNAVHPELKAMCEQVITAQRQEIMKMESWLRDWYGIQGYQPQMTRGEMRQMEKLRALSGAEFEIAFMRQLIRHHQKAIVRAATCTERAYHAELVEICEQIIEAQAAEIAQLRAWLCEWYGLCDRRDHKSEAEHDND